ncbi:MAG: hypothetical protein U0325_10655 [Polyangiales bacterium]
MSKIASRWVVGVGTAALLGFATLASGHPTGREVRSLAQCQRLPMPERGPCSQCVSRPLRHHYHPDYPPGARCRPDNGRP